MQTYIREAKESDLERCYEIETVSYGGDEAASKEKILKRIQTYPEGFIVLENDTEVMGFINGGATHEVELSDEEFKELVGHDPQGDKIVIMSVVLHPDYQKQGYTTPLMNAFLEKMKGMNKKEVHLICQTELITLYEKYGFKYIKASDSEHGGLSWHEMIATL